MTVVQKQIDRLLAQRASEWVDILKTAGPAEREAFVDWLRESRRHVEEFLSVVAIDRELDNIDLQGRFDRDALLRRVCGAVVPLPVTTEKAHEAAAPRRPARRRIVAIAAGFAVAALGCLLYFTEALVPTQSFVTAPGVQQSIELQDGSVVQLNADSQVRVRLFRAARELQLLRGEALFKVAHDTKRPFRVHVGTLVIQALGTQFNVNKQPAGTVVSVVEGKVRVSSDAEAAGANRSGARPISDSPLTPVAALNAGQQAVIEPGGTIKQTAAPDVARAITWQQQRLVFRKTPLEEIVRQFNSHNARPKLRLIGIQPGSHHYSATFDADDPQSFGDLLDKEPDLIVEHQAAEILVRRR